MRDKKEDKLEVYLKVFTYIFIASLVLMLIFALLKLDSIAIIFAFIFFASIGISSLILGYLGVFKKTAASPFSLLALYIFGIWIYLILRYILRKDYNLKWEEHSHSPIYTRIMGGIFLAVGIILLLAAIVGTFGYIIKFVN